MSTELQIDRQTLRNIKRQTDTLIDGWRYTY